jgi:hypothetical protein
MPRTKITTSYQPRIGSRVYFAPAGRTIEGGVVSKTVKPAGSVLTDWEPLGAISEGSVGLLVEEGAEVFEFNLTTGEDEVVRSKMEDASTRLQFDLTLGALSDYLWQLTMAAASVHADTGAFVPASLPGGVASGWALIQTQISTEKISVTHIWAELALPGQKTVRNLKADTTLKVQITQLRSPLDSGVLSTPAA